MKESKAYKKFLREYRFIMSLVANEVISGGRNILTKKMIHDLNGDYHSNRLIEMRMCYGFQSKYPKRIISYFKIMYSDLFKCNF